jgi:hypothetical protein
MRNRRTASRFLSSALRGAWWPGMTAGLLSALALAWRGRVENRSASGPINAPSQWVWGERAIRRDHPSMRYTLTGFAVHQLASLFWGVVHARTAPRALAQRPAAAIPALRHAAAVSSFAAGVTTLAAVVDLVVVPERLTPGFQRRLSARSLWCVYGAFAVGLALGQVLQPASERLPREQASSA